MPYARVAVAILGLAVIAGTLWLAIALPAHHCVYHGDVGSCQDRGPIKLGIGIIGVFVGVLILAAARATDPWQST